MFYIGQSVYTKNSGVCKIVAQEEKDFGIGARNYFVLESVYPKGPNTQTKTFISETTASNQMRELIGKEEAKRWSEYLKSAEKIWINDAKLRKQKFDEIYKLGNIKDICCLIKSLYLQNEELKSQKKTLSMYEKEFLDKMIRDLLEELSLVLECTIEALKIELDKVLIG